MRDHEQREVPRAAQPEQEVQHLRAHGGVERSDGLVADEARGLSSERTRDRDALALAPRELVRIAIPEALGGREPGILERGRGTQHAIVARHALHAQRLLHEVCARACAGRGTRMDPGRPSATCRAACAGRRGRPQRPRSAARPRVGCSSPSSVRASVVLPLPRSPTTPSTSLRRHSRSTPSSARTTPPPRRRCTSSPRASASGITAVASGTTLIAAPRHRRATA